jgi:integrase
MPRSKYIPHIYTKEEKQRFFHAVDNYPATSFSYRNDVDPELFRFLCCTGARLSEALNLKKEDYDEDNGTVFIRGAKNNRDRIIPLSVSFNKRLNKYARGFLAGLSDEGYLFPSIAGGKMDKSTAYLHFRDYLLMADIPHDAKGPRIHDFRHGLAVENLRRWAKEGADMSNKLPYLSAYMGHTDFRATQYYLRLTAEIYPEMVEMMEKACLDIIPEGGLDDNAEN